MTPDHRVPERFRDPSARVFTLYRHFDAAGRLLYIGKSVKVLDRHQGGHRKNAAWWTEITRIDLDHSFQSQEALDAAEVAAIKAERPLWNKKHNYFGSYQVPDDDDLRQQVLDAIDEMEDAGELSLLQKFAEKKLADIRVTEARHLREANSAVFKESRPLRVKTPREPRLRGRIYTLSPGAEELLKKKTE